MKKFLKRLWQNEKGFTLIELIIVIAILAIIAAVAIPNVLKAVDNSRKTSDVTEAKMIADAAAMILAKNNDASSVVYTVNDALMVSNIVVVAEGDTDTAREYFTNALLDEFTNGLPTPTYQGTTNDEETFILVIDGANNILEVYIGDDADTEADTNALQVYPTVADEYLND